MTSSDIQSRYGMKGLYNGCDFFEQDTFLGEFIAALDAERREFAALIKSMYQSNQFSYTGNFTQKAYLQQRKRLRLYNQLLTLYFNKKLTIERAFLKAVALIEKYGVAIPRLPNAGSLTKRYKAIKYAYRAESIQAQLEEVKESVQDTMTTIKTSTSTLFGRIRDYCLSALFRFLLRFAK